MKRKRFERGNIRLPVPIWSITFADLMSLILTFFILFLSFSSFNDQQFDYVVNSVQGAFGVTGQHGGSFVPLPHIAQRPGENFERAARNLKQRLKAAGRETDVRLDFDDKGGLKITLPDSILFEDAGAELKVESSPVLQDIGQILADLPEIFIEVRGHTDNRPLLDTSGYRDNYDLSYHRADAVARRLSDSHKIPLPQFEVVACGEGQPLATNESEDGRQANRRIEILVHGVLEQDKIDAIEEHFGAKGKEQQ